jgi:hypothetical protein
MYRIGARRMAMAAIFSSTSEMDKRSIIQELSDLLTLLQ